MASTVSPIPAPVDLVAALEDVDARHAELQVIARLLLIRLGALTTGMAMLVVWLHALPSAALMVVLAIDAAVALVWVRHERSARRQCRRSALALTSALRPAPRSGIPPTVR